jgi:hypothetical protein
LHGGSMRAGKMRRHPRFDWRPGGRVTKLS